MPIYEYKCSACGKKHEIIQKHDDIPFTVCPDCGGQMKKLISNTSFILKGTGWYKTDYASNGTKKAVDREKKNGEKPEKKSETKQETKSEPKSESKSEPKIETTLKT